VDGAGHREVAAPGPPDPHTFVALQKSFLGDEPVEVYPDGGDVQPELLGDLGDREALGMAREEIEGSILRGCGLFAPGHLPRNGHRRPPAIRIKREALVGPKRQFSNELLV